MRLEKVMPPKYWKVPVTVYGKTGKEIKLTLLVSVSEPDKAKQRAFAAFSDWGITVSVGEPRR